ncbi:hypothetical protein AAFF_G00221100 [Aldrovandia affinis]|uniref:Uncharacterized protein n=1 Tax=Aldrovandia affinis TaxID=143900 RepID=A0AAD7RG40_9TELE|nr:hypothetical protein AAFF_G00221100 [Aldrovandia affinis]
MALQHGGCAALLADSGQREEVVCGGGAVPCSQVGEEDVAAIRQAWFRSSPASEQWLLPVTFLPRRLQRQPIIRRALAGGALM